MGARSWVFGDGIDTDQILPSQHMFLSLDEMKQYAMQPQNEQFAGLCQAGDFVVGGENFGCGSSREQAPLVLKALGVKAIIAKSFARIFYRNAINLGLPVVELKQASDISESDILEIDLNGGIVRNITTTSSYTFSPITGLPKQIIDNGGLIQMLRKKSGKVISTDTV